MIRTGHQPLGELELLLTQAGILDAAAEASIIWQAAVREAGDNGAAARAIEMATGRARGTPLPYVTGRVEFMGVEVSIAPGALIPREETELLGRTAVELLNRTATAPRVIDMCCGSGNLACGIAMAIPAASVWASDLTAGAVSVAATNVDGLGLSTRVTVLQGDLFSPLEGLGLEGTIDAVVCNPPYISTGKLKKERAELLSHEPLEAFDGGPYGVSFFQRVIKGALSFLKPGGSLLFEIGQGQARQVSLLFTRANAYEDAWTALDPSGEPRVVGACRK